MVLSTVAHSDHLVSLARLQRVPSSSPVATACGGLAGAVGIGTSWPQAWRLWVGRRHAGLALSTNVLGVLFGVAWLLYGFEVHSRIQVITSTAGLAGAVVVLTGHVVRAGIRLRGWLPLAAAGLLPILVAAGFGRDVLGITASLATISGIVPQVAVLAKGRRSGSPDSGGVSRSRWLLSVTGNLLWVVYGVVVQDVVIAGNSAVIALLAAAVVALARPANEGATTGSTATLVPAAVLEAA